MAISAEYLNLSQTDPLTDPENTLLQRLLDEGVVSISQALNPSQFATLNALLHRLICHDSASPAPRFRVYPLGLDELDSLARTHTRYPFIELPPELQDAMLDLIAAGDLATGRLNLARWLEDLRSAALPRTYVSPPIERLY